MSDKEKIEELVALVKDLWEVRKYGIPEMDLYEKVTRAVSYDESELYLAGMRPIGSDGLSLTPDIVGGKVCYTRHFSDMNKLKNEAVQALNALYIAVEEAVARDVNKKVKAYILELESKINATHQN